MLTSKECREKIEYFDKMLVVKENIPPEEVHLRYHWKSLKQAYETELRKAMSREVWNERVYIGRLYGALEKLCR